jgi:hypothetical protein
MEPETPVIEHLNILSMDHYLSLLRSEKIRDCFSGLQHLSKKEGFNDKKIVVQNNIAEQIRDRYGVSKRAFYAANRSIEFTSQTTLDVQE